MYKIPLTKPYLPHGTKELVCEVLDGGFLTEGAVTKEFERTIKDFIGSEYAIAVTSCTVGLEIALRAVGVGLGDEVIVPDYTYPATANAVAIVGAQPVIVDVDPKTMLIDYDKIESSVTSKTKAVMPVSEFGNPLDYDRLDKIKKKYELFIIEDAACSMGSEYNSKKTGTLADISVFSLHPRKFITSGEGGIITTNFRDWADFMISYKHFGIKVENGNLSVEFERIGSNYKMSNILAAVAFGQMKHIDELLAKRISLAENYIDLLKGKSGIILPETTAKGKHSYQTFSVLVENRDDILRQLRAKGIEAQIGTYALHMHKAFATAGDCPKSKYVFERCLALPLYYEMTKDQQNIVVNELVNLCAE